MSYYRIRKHEGIIKKCSDCGKDLMKYVANVDSWICSWCANAIREEFMQITLPSTREQDLDEIQPESQARQQREQFYMKSINRQPSNYEDDLNLNLEDDNKKYRGSANEAIRQDNIARDNQLAKAKRQAYQRRAQFSGNIVGSDSTESQLTKFNRKQIRDRDEVINDR